MGEGYLFSYKKASTRHETTMPWDGGGTDLCMSVTGGGHERGDPILVCNRHVCTLLEQQVDHTNIAGGACLLDTDAANVSH